MLRVDLCWYWFLLRNERVGKRERDESYQMCVKLIRYDKLGGYIRKGQDSYSMN